MMGFPWFLRFSVGLVVTVGVVAGGAAAQAARSGEVIIVRNPLSAGINTVRKIGAMASRSFERVALPAAVGKLNSLGATRAVTSDLHDLLQYCDSLVAQGIASHCSPDYVYRSSLTPNDPDFSELFGLNNISAPTAWNITTGSAAVVVAVIDTGVQYTHPDLAANVWVNSDEVASDGLDNDGNGFIDDVNGYDFVDSDAAPLDENGHGTHVAGTVGAVGNNSVGVVGVNHSVALQALRVLDASGSGFTSDIISAVNYATANGAHVINMSLGGPGYSSAFEEAIRAAGDAGVLVVVAAGNESADNDNTPSYPANYDLPNVISVAATDSSDILANFSNFGATSVHIAAPGVDILSTSPGNTYEYLSGTSMACPHVAGAAALVKAANPALSALDLRALILDNADTLDSLSGAVVGAKRLNVSASVAASLGVTPIADPDPSPTVSGVTVSASRVGSRRYRIDSLVFDSTDGSREGVADIEIVASCKENNGRRKSYRKTGVSDSDGGFSTRITFSSGTSKATCRITTSSPRKSSRSLAFKVKR